MMLAVFPVMTEQRSDRPGDKTGLLAQFANHRHAWRLNLSVHRWLETTTGQNPLILVAIGMHQYARIAVVRPRNQSGSAFFLWGCHVHLLLNERFQSAVLAASGCTAARYRGLLPKHPDR